MAIPMEEMSLVSGHLVARSWDKSTALRIQRAIGPANLGRGRFE